MSYLLNIAYALLVVVLSPWLAYQAITKGKYREGFAAKFLGLAPRREGEEFCVWLHAVSVGEVNLLQTLIDEIARRRPGWTCVISTTTKTGYALACKKYAGHRVFYCPLDFTWAARTAVRRIRPDVLVLAELEIWPNLIRAAQASGAKVAIVNGRLSQRSYRGYRRARPLLARLLGSLDLIAAQTEEYAERFRLIGANPDAVHVTGSVKFDGAQSDRRNPLTQRLRALAGLADDAVVFLAGSTQEPEEALAIDTFAALRTSFPRLRLLLVPRHPERFDEVARLLERSGLPWVRRGQLDDAAPAPAANVTAPILLVDTIGELGGWWGAAQIAFVGGSLGRRGGQNMLEPAAYGAAVSFGPNTSNFRDTVALLLEADGAVVVHNGQELTEFVRRCLELPDFGESLGRRARELVASQQGAAGRTVDLLLDLERQERSHVAPRGPSRRKRVAAPHEPTRPTRP